MEEKNEKGKNIIIGILIGVTICLVIALVFICYNKFVIKNNTNTNNSNNSNNTSENNKPTEQENNIDYSGKFEKNGSDIIIKKNNEGYDIEIGIFRIGTFKGKTININNDKLTIVATAEKENDLEFEFDYNTKILTVTKSNWNLLSTGNTYQLDSNNDTITLDEIKEKYQINKGTGGQFGTVHESIVDKQTNTTIINNLQEFSQSSVYLLKNKGKVYFYVEGLNVFDGPLKSRLYDEKGNIIFDISNKYKFHLIFKDGEPNYTTNVFEVDGAYYTENGIINKYNLDGTKISNSRKYDDVIQVDQKYSLIYQSNDNSVYVISNDGNYSQKITTKNNYGYCMNDFSKNTNNADNKFIHVYLSDCPEPDGPIDYYKLDLVNNSVTFQKGY